ncbi:hypothetical protein [Nocardioides houyundeii]|uniref:hypothetical protein n=1 Tax=Nocardioides houyundeii TaxID=2045452 RepID=UPI0013B462FE|nr:hypothetical protein [Nocardioides houyundeii]
MAELSNWITVVVAPLVAACAGQLFAERARREKLRIARDEIELAVLMNEQGIGSEAQVFQLRTRAARSVNAYLRGPWRPKYMLILGLWIYIGTATGLIVLMAVLEQAGTGPESWPWWLGFAGFGAALGALFSMVHIALKDPILRLANATLRRLTNSRVTINRPASWGSPTSAPRVHSDNGGRLSE